MTEEARTRRLAGDRPWKPSTLPFEVKEVSTMNAALDPKTYATARAVVRAALGADDPTTALRAAALEIASHGLGRAGVEAVFVSVCEELAEQGRDEESSLIAHVLDMIAAW